MTWWMHLVYFVQCALALEDTVFQCWHIATTEVDLSCSTTPYNLAMAHIEVLQIDCTEHDLKHEEDDEPERMAVPDGKQCD